jgi:hypothetical protein
MEKRQYPRIAVKYRSHFTSKGPMVAGDGQLCDLSSGGCRVTSGVEVTVGTELELCIFSDDDPNPLMVDGAVVRWARLQEFGVAFTKVRPPVQRRINELCRRLTPLN